VLHVNRDTDKHAAVHGLTRALVFNAVHGVTAAGRRNWTLSASVIGAELKGKGTVVFTLGYSHPIEFPLPTGIEVAVRSEADSPVHLRHRPAEGGPGGRGHAFAAQA